MAIVDGYLAFANAAGAVLKPVADRLEDVALGIANRYAPDATAAASAWLERNQSSLSKRLPLMHPFHAILLALAYLLVLPLMKQLPDLRKAGFIKPLMVLHNLHLFALSFYMCTGIWAEASRRRYSWFGNPADETEEGWPMARMIWLFYFSKLPEFVDTFIMMLKRNYHQVSFLHVYHHSSIFLIWWLVTFLAPTGEAWYSAMLNSFIHVIMYGYYFSAAIGWRGVDFVKRYITMMQMTQFVTMMVQATYDIIHGLKTTSKTPLKTVLLEPALHAHQTNTYPLLLSTVLWIYMVTMLGLFANFFVRSYSSKESKKAGKVKKAE
ncbi:polyunsaturated fatty acid elongation enzyme [Hyaloraphidium curvatum]|nr:polyunsaturated fatty acid elongation enzyme [Hyaloraphidium curvatum]